MSGHAKPCAQLARHAVRALYAEVALEPKPGLVSLRDTGSHTDMDAGTFFRSLFALRHYFGAISEAGAQGLKLPALQALGLAAEQRMLHATGGINTHRGAIFVLGFLCAAAGRLQVGERPCNAANIRAAVLARWGDGLQAHAHQRAQQVPASHGQRVARSLGLRSAAQEAALGFPTLFTATLPALQQAVAQGHGLRAARVQALMATMAVLDDTNIAHRGGLEGLRWVQQSAREFLERGGIEQAHWIVQVRELHARVVTRRLSPGGAADLLAAACWLHDVERDARVQPTAPQAREFALFKA